MKFLPRAARVLFAATVVLGIGCSPGGKDGEVAPTARPNVVLVSIDTLRPDHLGCYGYPKPTSPNLDQFRADAVLFSQAIAHAPSTLPSHASILTSLLPQHHGASWARETRLAEDAVSVAEVLRDAGFRTAAFTGGGQMDRGYGLDQGFDLYEQPDESFAETVAYGTEWIRQGGSDGFRPFFLFLHTYETHHPYQPRPEHLALFESGYDGDLGDEISVEFLRELNRNRERLPERDLQHVIATYDAEIRSMDEGFADLVAFLKEAGLYDQTLLVFTSDHGEEFGEHDRVGWHSHTLYDELLRVPLLVKLPKQRAAGATVERQVRGIDLAPTILAAVDVSIPSEYLGIDLGTLLAGGDEIPDLPALSRLDRRRTELTTSVRLPQWKLAKRSLFDLRNDPEERWDVAFGFPEVVTELEELEAELLAAHEELETSAADLSSDALDRMRALGYLATEP